MKSWTNCYDDSWAGTIVPDAFCHPAKMAKGLLERIFSHGFERGYFKPGDTILDHFGGIGSTGIVGAYLGLRVVMVELEPRFCELAERNFAMHRRKWEVLGVQQPQIIQGDSRRLCDIVTEAGAIVCSPPFSQAGCQPIGNCPPTPVRSKRRSLKMNDCAGQEYGSTPGQLGAMKAGSPDAIVCSPPYAGNRFDGGEESLKRREGFSPAYSKGGGYGNNTKGQLGNMPPGSPDAIVCSPPWEDQQPSHAQRSDFAIIHDGGRRFIDSEYDKSQGQLGNESGPTYWQSVRDIYQQCLLVLRPGGVMCVVVKQYVKAGAIVDLPGQTWDLLQHIGFEPLEQIRASLVKHDRHPGLFEPEVVKTKKRVSFFRRLAEKRGSPPIDYEEVLWLRKPK